MPNSDAALRALAEAATPGPWRWFGQIKQGITLTTQNHGIIEVMGCERLGMQGAEPVFRVRDPKDYAERGWWRSGKPVKASEAAIREVPYRDDIVGIDNPDAAYIAAASPDRILSLLARLARAETALEWTRHRLTPYSHPMVCSPMVCRCGYGGYSAALEPKP